MHLDARLNRMSCNKLHATANCNKSIVSYGNLQGTFGVLDLNVLADNDWGNTISWLINGGANGFDDRIKYRNLLKKIMKYELCKNKK